MTGQPSSDSTNGSTQPEEKQPRKSRRPSKADVDAIRRKYDGVVIPGQLVFPAVGDTMGAAEPRD